MSEISPSLIHKRIGVAVIRNHQGKILIDRRKAGGEMGGLWEFPGGKVEASETIKQCIQREVREELAIEIIVEDCLMTIDHTYTGFSVTLFVHDCQYLSGEPQPIGCDEIHWVDLPEMNNYHFPEANAKIINTLQARGTVR